MRTGRLSVTFQSMRTVLGTASLGNLRCSVKAFNQVEVHDMSSAVFACRKNVTRVHMQSCNPLHEKLQPAICYLFLLSANYSCTHAICCFHMHVCQTNPCACSMCASICCFPGMHMHKHAKFIVASWTQA